MKYLRLVLIGLIAILIVLLICLFIQYESLRHEQVVNYHEFRWSEMLEHHAPLPAVEATVVRSWMTFDYINKIFALSPDYLKTQLQISDTHYPRITIAQYAKNAGIDQATLITNIENAIRSYVSTSTATSTIATTSSKTT